mmetsp:Transcript_20705/g.48361  ORF Transcript_20705/g.48361 Transcript_20705/m.48361 type:complete len:253 (-) Transcript_20705:551-1309(-)
MAMSNVRITALGFTSEPPIWREDKVWAAASATCVFSVAVLSRLAPREGADRGEVSDGELGEGGGAAATDSVSSLFSAAASRAARVDSLRFACCASWFDNSGQEITGRSVARCWWAGRRVIESLPLGGMPRPFKANGMAVGPLTVPPNGNVPGLLRGSRFGNNDRVPPISPGNVVPIPISFLVLARQEIIRNSITSWRGTCVAPPFILANVRFRLSSGQSWRLITKPLRRILKNSGMSTISLTSGSDRIYCST